VVDSSVANVAGGHPQTKPGKAQEGVDVGGGDSFSASNVMHGQLRVLNEPCLDVVSASDNPKQARIGCGTRELTLRSGRTHRTRARSNALAMLLHIRSLAGYTIDMLESSFWKRQPTGSIDLTEATCAPESERPHRGGLSEIRSLRCHCWRECITIRE
jgi:hypothetical protein